MIVSLLPFGTERSLTSSKVSCELPKTLHPPRIIQKLVQFGSNFPLRHGVPRPAFSLGEQTKNPQVVSAGLKAFSGKDFI